MSVSEYKNGEVRHYLSIPVEDRLTALEMGAEYETDTGRYYYIEGSPIARIYGWADPDTSTPTLAVVR